jgi:hypothetical protein
MYAEKSADVRDGVEALAFGTTETTTELPGEQALQGISLHRMNVA